MQERLFDSGAISVDHEGVTIPFPTSGRWPTWVRVDNSVGPYDVTVVTISDDAAAAPTTDCLVTAGEVLDFAHGPRDGGAGFRGVVLICAPGEGASVKIQAR